MTVYLDSDFCCHTEDGEGLIPFETDFFDGREEMINLYRIVPAGVSWTRSDGVVFAGEMITPIAPRIEVTSPTLARISELEAENVALEVALLEIEEALNG